MGIFSNDFFISFEGVDGSGKSTQIERLKSYFKKNRLPLITTKSPGSTVTGDSLRELLFNGPSMHYITRLLCFFASHNEMYNEVILPALFHDTFVISDRFLDYAYAYQVHGYGIDSGVVESLHKMTSASFLPSLTFLLDVNYEKSVSSISSRGYVNNADLMEEDVFNKVREGYLSLAYKNSHRYIIIDGNRDVDTVTECILSRLKDKLDSYRCLLDKLEEKSFLK